MPPDVAKNVAAVALLGKPNQRFMRAINQPEVDVGPLYADKTVELCVPDDFVCSSGRDFNAHTQYAETGMVDEAATFAAARLAATPAPAATPGAPAPAGQPHLAAPAAAPQAPAPAASAQQAVSAGPSPGQRAPESIYSSPLTEPLTCVYDGDRQG